MQRILLLLIWCATAPLSFGGSRLAVLADSATQPAADLLTVALSKIPGLELVERDELAQIVREQKLPATGALDQALRLTGLLHADGLLVLEQVILEEQPVLRVRLVASRPGAVIGAWIFTAPPEELAQSIVTRLQPYWQKLTLPPGRAVPLSLLNIRSPLSGAETLENQLTFLLANRLAAQPEILLLERWRTDDLGFEKALSEDSPFWTGSYVVDGEINSAGAGRLEVVVFVRPPHGGTVQQLKATGTTAELAEIAGQLAGRVVESLSGKPLAAGWNGAAESQEYFREALWALNAKKYSQARSAIEASWALGKRDLEFYRCRTRIYSALAFPEIAPREAAGRQKQIGLTPPYDPDFAWQTIDVGGKDAHVQAALGALNDARELAARRPPRESVNSTTVRDDGRVISRAILAASRVLRFYQEHRPLEGSLPVPLEELRRCVRETAAQARLFSPYWTQDVIMDYQRFWFETPAEACEGYRQILRQTADANPVDAVRIRNNKAHRSSPSRNAAAGFDGSGWLVSWTGAKPAELDAQWTRFLDSMAASSELTDVLDGAWLRVLSAKTPQDQLRGYQEFHETLWKNRSALLQRRLLALYASLSEYQYQQIPAADRLQVEDSMHWLDFYFENAGEYIDPVLNFTFTRGFTPAQISSIQERWRELKARCLARRPFTLSETQSIARFEQRLNLAVEPKDATEPRRIDVTAQWTPPDADPNAVIIAGTVWSEEKLWVLMERRPKSSPKQGQRTAICVLELPSRKVLQTIEAPPTLHLDLTGEVRPSLQVTATSLFVYNGSRFFCYDRGLKTWTAVPFPERPYQSHFAKTNSLIAGFQSYEKDESGILRWSGDKPAEVEVIASSRRRPALHRFDDCPRYSVGGLCIDADDRIGAQFSNHDISGKFFWFTPASSQCQSAFKQRVPYLTDPKKAWVTTIRAGRAGDNLVLSCAHLGIAIIQPDGKLINWPGSDYLDTDQKRALPINLPDALDKAFWKAKVAYLDSKLWILSDTKCRQPGAIVLECFDQSVPLSEHASFALLFAAFKGAPPGWETFTKEGFLDHSRVSDVNITATPYGLVFCIGSSPGIWILSSGQLQTPSL